MEPTLEKTWNPNWSNSEKGYKYHSFHISIIYWKIELDNLFYRRGSDLLQVYRIINQVDRLDFNTFFELNTYNTRGNTKKICKPRANSTIKQNSFNHRVINDWNNLSNDIVCAESINSFKTLLDKFWQSKNFKYEFVFYS